MLTHRPLDDADIPTICTFPQSAEELYFMFPAATWPLTPEQVRDSLATRIDPTVALVDGRLAGYANYPSMEAGGACNVGNVSVAGWARRHGVARFLVSALTTRAFAVHGAREVQLRCYNINTPALLLYQSLGFQPCMIERREDHLGRPVALFRLRVPAEDWRG